MNLTNLTNLTIEELRTLRESKLREFSRHNNRQMASKILLNSLFGACA